MKGYLENHSIAIKTYFLGVKVQRQYRDRKKGDRENLTPCKY
jgi:hypothetical protein